MPTKWQSLMIPIGPYRTLKTPEGTDFPYYIIPFDKEGRCEGPKTFDHLIANSPGHSDIFLFSHGWNNDWSAATVRYEGISSVASSSCVASTHYRRPRITDRSSWESSGPARP
jgi:hypothetical protein